VTIAAVTSPITISAGLLTRSRATSSGSAASGPRSTRISGGGVLDHRQRHVGREAVGHQLLGDLRAVLTPM
jgi:hypothetical protein